MSFEWTSHALKNGPRDSTEFVVYLALADAAKIEGRCWPSLKALAVTSRKSLSAVKRAMRRLVSGGWVDVIRRGNGAGHKAAFQLHISPDAKGVKMASFAERKRVKMTPFVVNAEKGVKMTQKGGQNDLSPKPPIRKNLSLTLSKGSGGSTATRRSARSAQAPPAPLVAKAVKRASLAPPDRKAALRRSPAKASGRARGTIPLSRPPRRAPAPRAARNSGTPGEASNSLFEPRDERFDIVANEIRNVYWKKANPGSSNPCPWGGEAKAQLSRLLEGECRDHSADAIIAMLMYRVRSIYATRDLDRGGINPADPPSRFLPRLVMFAHGPVNAFGDPLRERR